MESLKDLQAGTYILNPNTGKSVKALDIITSTSDFSWMHALGLDKRVDTDTLATKEVWTATALSKREQQLINVPWQWYLNETEQDDPPFMMDMWRLLPQIDRALQTKEHGAFLYKIRGRGRGATNSGAVTKVVWLDPDRMEPDLDSATHMDGITKFIRTTDAGQKITIPGKDILWFRRPGMRELQCGPSALEASRLSAEVLWNMHNTEDSFFEGNSLPYMLIEVPMATPDAEKDRIRDSFMRLFNRNKGPREVKTMGVREGVKVTPLSFKPSELDLGPTEARHIDAVLAAHDVPKSIALSNAANYATAIADKISFAETMASRMEQIAQVFNADDDFKAAGYRIEVDKNALPVMQEEERQRMEAVKAAVESGELLHNAYGILGVDKPKDYIEHDPEETRRNRQPAPSSGGEREKDPMDTDADEAANETTATRSVDLHAGEIEKLRRYVKNGTHVKRSFTSDVLTKAEIKRYQAQFIEELIDNEYRDYP